MLSTEQHIAAQKANVETLFGLTSNAFVGVEKLVKLNVQTPKTTLAKKPVAKRSFDTVVKSTTRRSVIAFCLSIMMCAVSAIPNASFAQTAYPSKVTRLIVNFPPGGARTTVHRG